METATCNMSLKNASSGHKKKYVSIREGLKIYQYFTLKQKYLVLKVNFLIFEIHREVAYFKLGKWDDFF